MMSQTWLLTFTFVLLSQSVRHFALTITFTNTLYQTDTEAVRITACRHRKYHKHLQMWMTQHRDSWFIRTGLEQQLQCSYLLTLTHTGWVSSCECTWRSSGPPHLFTYFWRYQRLWYTSLTWLSNIWAKPSKIAFFHVLSSNSYKITLTLHKALTFVHISCIVRTKKWALCLQIHNTVIFIS